MFQSLFNSHAISRFTTTINLRMSICSTPLRKVVIKARRLHDSGTINHDYWKRRCDAFERAHPQDDAIYDVSLGYVKDARFTCSHFESSVQIHVT